MLKTMLNAWKNPDLRKKILYTLLIIVIFRFGCALPVPFLDPAALSGMVQDGNIFGYLNVLSGGALEKGTVFALSIQPYINAQIIIQLLTYALPPLENLAKEGEEGRKKIAKITGFVALGISLVMSYAYYLTMSKNGAVVNVGDGFAKVFVAIVIIATFTAGANLIVFLGNLVNENGIGNGISIILFAGIIARVPVDLQAMIQTIAVDPNNVFQVIILLLIYVVMIGFIVMMNEAERRIPVTYARRVVGRKQYGGQSSYIPIKIAMSGVMPIIFAMAFMSIPATIEMFIPDPSKNQALLEQGLSTGQKIYAGILHFFSYQSGWYALIYFVLIIAFNYFYVSMIYNPIEIANQLRQSNGGIPGIRPGKPTSDFIQRVLSKITLIGAVCLGLIAVFPIIYHLIRPEMAISMAGTSILIIVSVALETLRTLESQMMMRHHKGFLE